MYNEFKETVKNPTILAKLAPLLNPATALPIIAVGTIWYCVYKMSENTDDEPLQTVDGDTLNGSVPIEKPIESSIDIPIANNSIENMDKKELIRRAMSELGKRSGRARAKQSV